MRIFRIIGYGFMVLVLAGGWAFMYWQSGAVDLVSVEGARASLGALRAVDAGWNQQLVRARLYSRDAAASAPAVAAPASRHRPLYASLEVRALRLGSPVVGSELAQLKRAFEDKATSVVRFGETHAALLAARSVVPVDDARVAELQAISDVLFDQAWLASTGPRLDTLGRALDRVSDELFTQAELYRVALLYYSGFLLAVLAFLVLSLAGRRR